MSEYQSLQILDELGFPLNPNKILFSSFNNILIYSFGSNIIYYNLNNNIKTFIQIYASNEILLLKFIDNENNVLLAIDNNSKPLINIWNIKKFENIFNQEILIKDNYGIDFPISNIFIEKIKNNYFFIFISSLTCNDYILYILYLSHEKYYLEPFCSQINQLNNEHNKNNKIIGFKFFLNTQTFLIAYNDSIEFYEISFENRNCTLKKNIKYNFNILPNSLSLSFEYNFISFISSEGNCLVYDKNYYNRTTIKPYNQDIFIVSNFFQDSLYLGTNNGKIYVYQASDYKLKYYINYNKIYSFKKEFQINFNKNISNKDNEEEEDNEYDYEGPRIEYLECDEKNDKIFIKLGDNSILLCPISFIIDNNNGYINEKLKGNSPLLYAYNHSKTITDIEFFPLANNEIIDYPILNNQMQTVFYTCSKDQTIIKYFINHEDNKLYNQFFDFHHIFIENNFKMNKYLTGSNNNEIMNYFTIIKFHPIQKNYLYIGDKKGCLYILDTNKNSIIYKQYIGETYSIDSLFFNNQGNLLCIGYETGIHILYYINIMNYTQLKFEKYLILNNHYFLKEEIEMRHKYNHILSYSYFFSHNKFNENKMIYMKSNNDIEYCLITQKNNNYKEVLYNINMIHKILDIKVHTGENYIIILDDNLQINIYDLMNKNIRGIIDLSGQLKYAYNMAIDISGLYLSLLCQLKDSKNEKSDIVLFEIGTGNVYSYLSGMSSLIKIKFDNSGKYLITIGAEGEVSLLGLDENVINSIHNVIKQMYNNPKFFDEYEIIFENKKDDIHNKYNYNGNQIKDNKKYENKYNTKYTLSPKYKDDRNNSNNYNYNFKLNYKSNQNNNSINTNKNNNKHLNTENDLINNNSNNTFNIKTKKNRTFSNIGRVSHFSTPNDLYKKSNSNFTNNTNSIKSIDRFNYTMNKYNNIPKLSYINIVSKTSNTYKNNNKLNIKDKMKFNVYSKIKKENQVKSINTAINELMHDETKDLEIENDNKNQTNSKIMHKFNFSNNILNNNLSSFYSSETFLKNRINSNYDINDNLNFSKDFMIINNKKINNSILSNKHLNNSNNTTFLIYHKDKHKKYPEPKDIDHIENFYYINNNISNIIK